MIESLKSKLIQIFKNHSLPRWLVLFIDMSVVFFAFLIAYMLRYNFEVYSFETSLAFKQAFNVLGVYTLFMLLFQSYAGMIRHATLKDTYKIIFFSSAALIVLITTTLVCRYYDKWESILNIPMSILIIHFGAVNVFLIFFRVLVKMFYEFSTSSAREKRNVLIYGSGSLGVVVKRVIEGDPKSDYKVLGFIDDAKKLQGKYVNGSPVYSRKVLTKKFVEEKDVKVFIIAINNIEPTRKKGVIESMIQLGCEILDTPSFDTWLNGQLQIKNFKKVKLEDLLAREPIILDLERIEEGLTEKTILVSGAAGSIGSEIARQLTRFKTGQLILVDQAETPSFYLGEELKEKMSEQKIKIIIGDVTQQENMEHIFRKYRPEIIFHAAAYKHVPIMESHPHEAFRVNVGGTKILTELAIKYEVEKFVMISSDKAVNPTNVMGATKKICELLVQAQSHRDNIKTQFVTTRFGNVLGSNGSVIPLFKKQIQEGGPVTITHPDITRFFMTIPEACQLVLEAGFMGNGGQIYVFDMGEPIKILDVAKNLIHLSGLEPDKDIKIVFTGLRPGEKLYEELFAEDEPMLPTHNPKISIAQVGENNFDLIIPKINSILDSLYTLSDKEVIEKMQKIVPSYKSKFEFINM